MDKPAQDQETGPGEDVHFAVSDIHGHVEQLIAALRRAQLLDSDHAWCGGRARLTILGDFFDRGPDGIGVVDLVRRLQGEADRAGGCVDALLGNHEILALGMHRFGDRPVHSPFGKGRSFARSWALNGGRTFDQQRLTDEHIDWLSGLNAIVLAGPHLLLHSDTTEYLRWGDGVQGINEAIRSVLAGDDLGQWWECWVALTSRYAFADAEGEKEAIHLLDRLGGERIVHGHTIIATLTGQGVEGVTGPLLYAGGRALAIDGGIYAGGPCLVVRLDDDPAVPQGAAVTA